MRLYDVIASAAAEAEVEEAQFIDAVSRNLRRGRFLLLIVGDGIQAGAERLADFLQQHAGLHFTLALVELAIFELPSHAGYLVQPRVLARTLNIERGIVTIDEATSLARMKPPATPTGATKVARRTTISEEKFFEELSANDPELTGRLRAFLDTLDSLGIKPEFGKASLILRWQPDDTHKFNLGYVYPDGRVWTDATNWVADRIGRLDLSHRYIKCIAGMVEGGLVKQGPKPTQWYAAVKSGGPVRLPDLLNEQDQWRAAMEQFVNEATAVLKD